MKPMAELPRGMAHIKRMTGRPRAVTRELLEAGRKLLDEGETVLRMCERLGVHHRSWYRATRPAGTAPARKRRNKQALPKVMVERIRALRQQGLTLRAIAERLGIHINTLHKYCAQLGLIERRPCGCPMKGRPHAGCEQHAKR